MHSSIRNFNTQTQRKILAQQNAHTFVYSDNKQERALIATHYSQVHNVECLQSANLRCNTICATFRKKVQQYAEQAER